MYRYVQFVRTTPSAPVLAANTARRAKYGKGLTLFIQQLLITACHAKCKTKHICYYFTKHYSYKHI
jgi:hypothetical protein